MKKFINDPEDFVVETLSGFAAAHANLVEINLDSRVAKRRFLVSGKVALVSGGGFGHEPMHFGFIGLGALDAACVGMVFSSPNTMQILEMIKTVQSNAGVLLIVKNYAGDSLNFKLAAEMTTHPLELVLVADDCAFTPQTGGQGRRGMGATVLIHKIAGAMAETGANLQDVARVAHLVNTNARSFGVALESCVTPNTGEQIFQVANDEIEVGVGIHGERGVRREKFLPAKALVALMLEPILRELELQRGDQVLVLVNGLGATPLGELYILFHEVVQTLQTLDMQLSRSLVGSYLTSLDMAGASITILKLNNELLNLWDAPIHTAVLRWGQ
jgi:phosphoenolpyruvate---glycerone phosphotransferase subunit DhaK